MAIYKLLRAAWAVPNESQGSPEVPCDVFRHVPGAVGHEEASEPLSRAVGVSYEQHSRRGTLIYSYILGFQEK